MGYWKFTGNGFHIKSGSNLIGGRKRRLVFYAGRAPKGERTEWIIHEFSMIKKLRILWLFAAFERLLFALLATFQIQDTEWYFFSHRGKKYQRGSQTQGLTNMVHRKSTGKARERKLGSNPIGKKRTRVLYWLCPNKRAEDRMDNT